jgi:class 3 adenylate cyclase
VRLVSTAFITLDGVMEGPGGDEHRDGRNGWALRLQDKEMQDWNLQLVLDASAIVLGRKTYQIWAAFWPSAEPSPLKERLDGLPKYVVSRTLHRADWVNTTILSGDAVSEIAALKAREGGDLLMYGSADLTNAVLAADLVDEYRLQLFPVVLGSGKHLFADKIATHYLRLVATRTFRSGVVLLTYRREAQEPTSPYLEQYTWTDEQIRSFQASQNADRILASVLFTDIVDSTARAATLGDRAWRELLDRHHEIARREVARWLGRHVESTGDGIMAIFETPTRALQSAFGLQRAVADLGLRMRAGIHTGEIERRETGYGGIGVHIAARVAAQAGAGQILVTRTVRDLSYGTAFDYRSLGSFSLKGVPGEWELLEVSVPTGS